MFKSTLRIVLFICNYLKHSAKQLKLEDDLFVLSKVVDQQDRNMITSSVLLEHNVNVNMISTWNFVQGSTMKFKQGSTLASLHSEMVLVNSTLGISEYSRLVFRGVMIYLVSSTMEFEYPHLNFGIKYYGEFRLQNVCYKLVKDFTFSEEEKLTISQPGVYESFNCVANTKWICCFYLFIYVEYNK